MADEGEVSKPATPEEVILRWPLYRVYESKGFYLPSNISRYCRKCGKETTWHLAESSSALKSQTLDPIALYQCGLCQKDYLTVIFRTVEGKIIDAAYRHVKVQKVGQFPPLSIDVPSSIEKALGDSASFYKNALVCRNSNFGIGALAYMRRVVEDKTNELILVVAELAHSHNVDAETIEKIVAATTERTTFDQKLKIASEVLPPALKPDGANPLALLYGFVSDGLHARTEDECLQITDEIRDVFEYIFVNLRAQIEDREKFVAKVQKWAGGRSVPASEAQNPKKGNE